MVIIEFKCGVYANGQGIHSGVDKRLIRNVGWVERSSAAISPIKQEVRQRKKTITARALRAALSCGKRYEIISISSRKSNETIAANERAREKP